MLWKYLLWITFCKLSILHPFFEVELLVKNIDFLDIRIIELDGKNLDRFPVGNILQHALFTKKFKSRSLHKTILEIFMKVLYLGTFKPFRFR